MAAAGVVALAGRCRHLVVAGTSMAPALLPGDRLVAVRSGRRPRVGQLALVADPRMPGRILVKRVHAVRGDMVDVRGDNTAASTDSRAFGPLPIAAVDACVVVRYHPPDRAGRVSAPRAPEGRRARRRAGRR